MQKFLDRKSFARQVCNGAQTCLIADKKSSSRILYRRPPQKVAPVWRIIMNVCHYVTDRYHPLPNNYIPADLVRAPVPFIAPVYDMKRCISLVAYDPIRKLFKACFKDGLNLMGISAFRSYDRQKEIYDTSVTERGITYTRAHIAFPGTSEHQTGLAIDVSCPSVNYELCEEFQYSPEGLWLKEHAGEFGFVFSFTEENSCYTGYVNEPWHIRYICKDAAYYCK